MDILIKSTKDFERDLKELNETERAEAIEAINHCASLFPTHKADVYLKLLSPSQPLSLINDYESSLYNLRVAQNLEVVLAVDEDPIFGQVVFTLFRAVKHDNLDEAYKSVAESLYQGLLHHNRETAQIS